jgi:hypothetical protein
MSRNSWNLKIEQRKFGPCQTYVKNIPDMLDFKIHWFFFMYIFVLKIRMREIKDH